MADTLENITNDLSTQLLLSGFLSGHNPPGGRNNTNPIIIFGCRKVSVSFVDTATAPRYSVNFLEGITNPRGLSQKQANDLFAALLFDLKLPNVSLLLHNTDDFFEHLRIGHLYLGVPSQDCISDIR
jgi:hypothetical protein